MTSPIVVHSTFSVERTYPAAPEHVFAAFSNPAKKRRWFAEGEGFVVDGYELDFRVGGSERTRFRTVTASADQKKMSGVNDTFFMDIVDDRRIVLAYTMTIDGRRISSSQATFEFTPAEAGTTLVMTEQAAFFDGADGKEMREAGWRQLLEQLGREVARTAEAA